MIVTEEKKEAENQIKKYNFIIEDQTGGAVFEYTTLESLTTEELKRRIEFIIRGY